MKKILYGLIIFHFLGAGIYGYYAEWKYKNENSFINSTFFSQPVSILQSIIWEYFVFKQIYSNNQQPTLLRKVNLSNQDFYIVKRGTTISIEVYKNDKFLIAADDINNDMKIDKCFSDFSNKCDYQLLKTSQNLLYYYYLNIFELIESIEKKDFNKFKSIVDNIDTNYIDLLLNGDFINQKLLKENTKYYDYIKNKSKI